MEAKEAYAQLLGHWPKDNDCGAYRSGMKDKVELKHFVGGEIDSENLAENFKMSARTDRQVFGKPLHDAKD